jgi:hypothetical protein
VQSLWNDRSKRGFTSIIRVQNPNSLFILHETPIAKDSSDRGCFRWG